MQRLCSTAAPSEDLHVESCSFNAKHVRYQRAYKVALALKHFEQVILLVSATWLRHGKALSHVTEV